jgi:uncharacterized SAM-binding protein YcdF (DUF218 family)
MFSKQPSRKKKFLIVGFLTLYLFSNQFLFNEVERKWEIPLTKLESVGKYDYVIVLGGFSSYDLTCNRVKFGEASDRMWQGLQLYYQKKVKKIFISGGSGLILHQDETEADKVKAFLISIKVPESDIIMEMTSRNTHENAVFTQAWLKKHDPGAQCLLVTSAAHMRRALGCYKKEGVNVTPYSAHQISELRKFDFDILVLPQAGPIDYWSSLIKEWVGYAAYRVAGYI